MLMEELIFNKMYFKLCLLITFLQWTNSTISTLIRVLLVICGSFKVYNNDDITTNVYSTLELFLKKTFVFWGLEK